MLTGVIFVMGVDNECLEFTKSIAINFFRYTLHVPTVTVTKTE